MVATVKWMLGSILLLLATVVGIVLAVGVFFGLAFIVDSPLVLALAAVTIGAGVAGGLARLLARRFARHHKRRLAASFAIGTALLLLVAGGLFVFRPLGFDEPDPVDRSGVRFESLTTGSRLACRIIPASGATRRGGVIFVHGGPGADAVANDPIVTAMSLLADSGFEVCLYDQIGSGLSERLADPGQYTVARHIDDLEALRRNLGWEQPVLIGKSWGAQLIARYAAKYPRNLSAAVLVSPGPLCPADWVDRETGRVTDRMADNGEREFNQVLDARLITAMLLFRINPQAAYRFLPEAEAERYGSAILAALAPGAVCDKRVLSHVSRPSLNFWAAQTATRGLKNESPDHLAKLAAVEFPVLVLRGDCDYAREGIAADYVSAFPRADLVTVNDAGHFMLLEKPRVFAKAVSEFLEGQP